MKTSAERVGSGEAVLSRPQKSASVSGAGRDRSAGDQAAVKLSGGADLGTVERRLDRAKKEKIVVTKRMTKIVF